MTQESLKIIFVLASDKPDLMFTSPLELKVMDMVAAFVYINDAPYKTKSKPSILDSR